MTAVSNSIPHFSCHCCGDPLPDDTPTGACPDCKLLDVALCDMCARWCLTPRGDCCGTCAELATTQLDLEDDALIDALMESPRNLSWRSEEVS